MKLADHCINSFLFLHISDFSRFGPLKGKNEPENWKHFFRRAEPDNLLEPKTCHRICSLHFSNGRPTKDNPMPDCHQGHNFIWKEKVTDRDQRTLKCLRVDTFKEADEQPQELQEEDGETDLRKTSLCVILKFVILMLLGVVRRKNGIIKEQLSHLIDLKKRVAHLKNENISLRKNNKLKDTTRAKCLPDQILINDKDVNFFTGIQTRALFNNFRDFFAKFVNRRWQGISFNFNANPPWFLR